jgi:hypothetical protein
MKNIPTISIDELEAVTGGNLKEPPAGSQPPLNPGAGGEAKHKKNFSEKLGDWVNEWHKYGGQVPY